MENNLTYKEIVNRLSYFRVKKNMSARELALRMGHSETYFYKVENGSIILNLPTFLSILEVLEVSTAEFFYPTPETFEIDAKTLGEFNKLSDSNRARILDLMDNLK